MIKVFLTISIFALFLNTGSLRSATVNITVADHFFYPADVHVNIGDTVKWTKYSQQVNSITCDGLTSGTTLPAGAEPWNVILDNGISEFSYVVHVAGTYNYLSTYNSEVMKGTIVVYTLLPVELTDFVATTIKNEVILDWTTTGETNNDRFEIQRIDIDNLNIDDPSNLPFVTVGHLTGNGTTNALLTYKFRDRNLESGIYLYRLKQIDYNSNFIFHLLNDRVEIGIPDKFILNQNFPNPFNPVTKISFELPADGFVKLKIYDLTGKVVSTLLNENLSAGYHTLDFSATDYGANISSGIYFYIIEFQSGESYKRLSRRMMLVK